MRDSWGWFRGRSPSLTKKTIDFRLGGKILVWKNKFHKTQGWTNLTCFHWPIAREKAACRAALGHDFLGSDIGDGAASPARGDAGWEG
jgi:hypothetical protein